MDGVLRYYLLNMFGDGFVVGRIGDAVVAMNTARTWFLRVDYDTARNVVDLEDGEFSFVSADKHETSVERDVEVLRKYYRKFGVSGKVAEFVFYKHAWEVVKKLVDLSVVDNFVVDVGEGVEVSDGLSKPSFCLRLRRPYVSFEVFGGGVRAATSARMFVYGAMALARVVGCKPWDLGFAVVRTNVESHCFICPFFDGRNFVVLAPRVV